MKKMIAVLAAAALLAGCGTSTAAAADTSAAGVSGTYSGKAQGHGGDVTVTITLEDGKITDVKADGPDETAGLGDTALETLSENATKAGSLDVDSVSGATDSSNAFFSAAASALESAGLNAADYGISK